VRASREEFIATASMFALAGIATKNAKHPRIAAAEAKDQAEALADLLGLRTEAAIQAESTERPRGDLEASASVGRGVPGAAKASRESSKDRG
jgi:hypothetical protein